MSLLAELKRRNVYRVGAAYLVVAWLLIQVATTLAPQLDLPTWVPRLVTLLLLLGFPIALLMAWFLERAPEGLKFEAAESGNKRVIGVAIVLAGLATAWYLRSTSDRMPEAPVTAQSAATQPASTPASASGPTTSATAKPATAAPRSIAVLPFVNMSSDPEQEFFADGLSEEILNSLARIDGMQVVGRTSSFQFKGRNEDMRKIGEQLGVATVLEGSVRSGKDRARITAQLVRVADGIHLWSQTYDREIDDTLAVQLDIAENVATVLDVVLDDAQRERMRAAGVRNVEAFVAYQKGRSLYNQSHDPKRTTDLIGVLRLANVEFARAVALEPDFGVAHYLASDLFTHIMEANTATDAERREAMAAAQGELELAMRSAHHPGQRMAIEVSRQLLSNDWGGLAERFREASEKQECTESNWLLVGSAFGLARERLQATRRRLACDPLATATYFAAVEAALWAGEPQLALDLMSDIERATGKTVRLESQQVEALLALGRIDEARARVATLAPESLEGVTSQLYVAAATGADHTEIAERSRQDRDSGWYPERWRSVDALLAVMNGDRAAGNRIAAELDARPGGPFLVALHVAGCACGASFDLDAAPNFKARLAESGLAWPPRDRLATLRAAGKAAP